MSGQGRGQYSVMMCFGCAVQFLYFVVVTQRSHILNYENELVSLKELDTNAYLPLS